jgi:radical SAM superfamily enzyme YgiQ (UPF0313 family)
MKLFLCTIPKSGVNTPSLALGYLQASCKKQGIEVELRDLNYELWKNTIHTKWWEIWKESNTDLYKGERFNQFIEEVYEDYLHKWAMQISVHEANFIGISCFSYRSLPSLKLLSPLIREYAPEKKIIVGGAPIPTYANWIIENNLADYVVVGEGDIVLPEIILGKHQTGIVTAKQIEDLDSLPPADYEGLDFKNYIPGDPGGLRVHENPNWASDRTEAGIMGSRGCVRQCTFCDVAHYWPQFRWRSAESIYAEMKQLLDQGINEVYFYDSLINGNQKEFERLLDIIIENGSQFRSIKGLAIFKSQPERIFEKMAKANIKQLSIGVESFSEEIRTQMKKKFSNATMESNLELYKKYGIKVVLLMIVGYPSEKEKHHKENLKWIREHKHMKGGNPISRIEIGGTMLILPGAPVFKNHMFDYYQDENNDWITVNGKEVNNMDVRVRRRIETEEYCVKYGFATGSVYGDGGLIIGDHEKNNATDYKRPQDKLIPVTKVDDMNTLVGWESDPTRPLHHNL